MQKIFTKVIILSGILSLMMGIVTPFDTSPSYASDLEIIGKEIGLEVNPRDTKLFDLINLNPGDIKDARIDIKNKYTEPFEVFIRAERTSLKPGEGEVDLFEQLILIVYLDGVEIHSGSMKDYATSNISLGDFDKNSKKQLRAVVHLPGLETGNEFQGKSVEVKWIFIAELESVTPPYYPPGGGTTVVINPTKPVEPKEELEEPKEPEEETINESPNLPKAGELPAIVYYSFGSILIYLGLKVRKKEKTK